MTLTRAGRILRDDPHVRDEEDLLRRIHPSWINPKTGELLDLAFLDRRTDEVSVFRSELTTQQDVLRGWGWMGLAEVRAVIPREHNHGVTPDPDPLGGDASHAVIFPLDPSLPGKRIKADAHRIALRARMLVAPP